MESTAGAAEWQRNSKQIGCLLLFNWTLGQKPGIWQKQRYYSKKRKATGTGGWILSSKVGDKLCVNYRKCEANTWEMYCLKRDIKKKVWTKGKHHHTGDMLWCPWWHQKNALSSDVGQNHWGRAGVPLLTANKWNICLTETLVPMSHQSSPSQKDRDVKNKMDTNILKV